MARRSRQELIEEVHRLSDTFETAMDILCEIDPRWQADRHLVIPRENMVSAIEQGRATPSEILAGLRAGLSDLVGHPQFGDPQRDPVGAEMARRYRDRTGRSLLTDAGDPRRVARQVLRRGLIRDDDEARLISGYLADTTGGLFTPDQRDRATALLRDYEATPSGDS